MATDAVQLCNLALLRVGVKDFIESLTEDTVQGQACNVAYALCLDTALASAPWPFATKRATLSLLTDVARTDWDYCYQVPTDCLRALFVVSASGRNPRADQRTPFEVEANGTGLILLTDTEDAELVYTARVTTVPRFSPLFADALAWLLASELVLGLAVKPELGRACLERYQLALSKAATAAANERQADAPPVPEWIAGRG